VGELIQGEGGALRFTYGSEWIDNVNSPAISASLPKQAKPFAQRECRPFFGGLLLEESQRRLAALALGISASNDFAMLDRLGGELAGALQLLPVGTSPKPARESWNPKPLEDLELLQLLRTISTRPMLAGDEGLRLCLAGAQSKIPVVMVDGRVALPMPEQPTTHILKPAIPHFASTTENEAFAMRLASAAGLDVAAVDPCVIRALGFTKTFLLVERYDRAGSPGYGTRRLHQEDMCQILRIPVQKKYQCDGGPSLEQCFGVIRRISAQPATDTMKLLDAVIFNAVLGNADAHGKNFSLLYSEAGPVLAPLYDLLSTVFYPELSPNFAMKIGRQSKGECLNTSTWADFAKRVGLDFPMVQRRLCEIAGGMLELATPTSVKLGGSGLDDAALDLLSEFVKGRARLCLSSLANK
jgi:serine/threonine-protein kinase HipA